MGPGQGADFTQYLLEDNEMALSRLASEIYQILRGLVPGPDVEITYANLVAQLRPVASPEPELGPRDPRLHEALGEIVTECHSNDLPALPAIVVRKACGTPGKGYFRVAHPGAAHDTALSMIEWGKEVLDVRRTTYPDAL